MPNGMYGGVRGRKTKVGRKLLLFSSYSIGLWYPDPVQSTEIIGKEEKAIV